MTEAAWLTSTDPEQMLVFLKGKVSARKLRLFATACCNRYSHMLVPETLDALRVAERFAEGHADQNERRAARHRAFHAEWNSDLSFRHRRGPAKACVTSALARQAYEAANRAACLARHIGLLSKTDWDDSALETTEGGLKRIVDWSSGKTEQNVVQAETLLDIFGNPFRPVILDPTWLTPTVVNLAQTIYDESAFDRMPELAAALAQSACTNAEILEHCRGPGPHVRGCWVIDLILEQA